MAKKDVRPVHRILSDSEIEQTGGGYESQQTFGGGTGHETQDGTPYPSFDEDVGGTWKWSF